jgi:hypothetical protein
MTKPMRFNPASSLFVVITIVITSGLISPVNDQIEVSEITSEIQLAERSDDPIAPYRENPWYWEYRGEPVLLIGASDQDNLFQWTGEELTDHLDLLTSVGGNYLRNTMSDRDEGNLYAFQRLENGQYDLDQWNEEYWERLEFFLKETHNRNIIVQLTLWDQFDLGEPWPVHAWNPANNINYSGDVIGSRDDFYNTVESANDAVLSYQEKFVDQILSISLQFDHVLYNINNESSEGKIWENYWGEYINRKADESGAEVYVTTMQFDPSTSVRHVMTHRDIFSFAEISQNNQDSRGGRGPAHYENIINWRQKIGSQTLGPMPMNNVKVYGSLDGPNYSAGTAKEAAERFWRNIFAGSASSRFHRPAITWGIGLDERAQINLNAMKMLLDELDIFTTTPHNDLLNSYVELSGSMEAYCLADIGNQYAVYFPAGRYSIDLDPWVYIEQVRIKWLDIDEGSWSDEEIVDVHWEGSIEEWGDRGRIRLTTPSNRSYVAFLEVVE